MRQSSFSWTEDDWRRLVATGCLSAAVFVTSVLLTRLPGSPAGLSAWWTVATGVLVAGLGAAAVGALTLGSTRRLSAATQSALAVTVNGLTLLSTLATTTKGGPGQLALACLLSLCVAGAFHFWSIASGSERPDSEDARTPASDPAATFSLATATDDEDAGARGDAESAAPLADHVDQTLSRYAMDGRDHLEACVRVRFEAGQQTAIVHLPIQPAMQFDPEVECESIGDSDVRITVDPAQPYGVRLVCRRPGPLTQAAETVIAVLISADRMARAAA